MAPKYKEGQTVRYKPVGGPNSNTAESTGVVKKVLTQSGQATDRNVEASEESPRYEIANSNTGKTSAIKEENILGTA
ncbi:MAG: hypothetical protein M1817_006689 [Caeruleum heppii]|nr:MAG: hypothetical protein M1817_006689 [Caeruleum heppii]